MSPFLIWCLCVGIGSALLVGMVYLIEHPCRPGRRKIEERGPAPQFVCTRCGRDFSSWEKQDAKTHDCIKWIGYQMGQLRADAKYLENSRDRITDAMNQGARLSTRIGSLEAKLEKRPDSVQQTQYAALEGELRNLRARIVSLEVVFTETTPRGPRRRK